MQTTRYRILSLIARGGMGEVFEALATGDAGFERRVALKRLTEAGAEDPRVLRMFLDEARIASKLHHAGIVAVLDFGVVDGAPFQILELVDGMSAAGLVRGLAPAGRSLPVEIALHVVREVAHALDHAHHRLEGGRPLGIVHRDVKPANILLSWEGDVKLGDFGIARAHDRSERTATGDAKGTSGYMAPEQARAEAVDGRTDVFSLGATLLALVLGRNPLADLQVQIGLALHDELVLPKEVPDDVAAIVRRALRRDPDARFPSARAMADALSEALAKRSAGDGRRALADLLASLRTSRPRAGALDALLQLDLIPEAAPRESPDVRTYTARAVLPPPPGDAPTAREVTEATVPVARQGSRAAAAPGATFDGAAETVPGPPLRSRAVPIAGALLVLGALGSVAVVRWYGRGGGEGSEVMAASPSRSEATSSPSTSSLPMANREAPPSASSASSASSAPSTSPSSLPPPSSPGSTGAPPRSPGSAAAAGRADPAPSSSPSVGERGVIAIGGEPTARIRVTVDGAFAGHAPTFATVAVGSHAVRLAHPDGRTHATTVVVTSAHTTRSPARVMPPF